MIREIVTGNKTITENLAKEQFAHEVAEAPKDDRWTSSNPQGIPNRGEST